RGPAPSHANGVSIKVEGLAITTLARCCGARLSTGRAAAVAALWPPYLESDSPGREKATGGRAPASTAALGSTDGISRAGMSRDAPSLRGDASLRAGAVCSCAACCPPCGGRKPLRRPRRPLQR